jgi:hypothetical protein
MCTPSSKITTPFAKVMHDAAVIVTMGGGGVGRVEW